MGNMGVRIGGLVGKGDELVVGSSAGVLGLETVSIVEHHGESGDPLADAKGLVFFTVDFGDVELVLHASTELCPCRGQFLAVSAPRVCQRRWVTRKVDSTRVRKT